METSLCHTEVVAAVARVERNVNMTQANMLQKGR